MFLWFHFIPKALEHTVLDHLMYRKILQFCLHQNISSYISISMKWQHWNLSNLWYINRYTTMFEISFSIQSRKEDVYYRVSMRNCIWIRYLIQIALPRCLICKLFNETNGKWWLAEGRTYLHDTYLLSSVTVR